MLESHSSRAMVTVVYQMNTSLTGRMNISRVLLEELAMSQLRTMSWGEELVPWRLNMH